MSLNRELKRIDEAVTRSKMNKISEQKSNTFFAGSILSDDSYQPGDSVISNGETPAGRPKGATPSHYATSKRLTGSNSNKKNEEKGGGGCLGIFCVPKKAKKEKALLG
mmetsp:Transcript_39529/g.35317  ORF Transcript_39529/g.35317 Transcript_39529/m.35317 type:complete len:108 (+) Transcript_39529:183-506(+)